MEAEMTDPIVCVPRSLPAHKRVAAARQAIRVNPLNRPSAERIAAFMLDASVHHDFIAAVTTKYWRTPSGVRLTVKFLDDAPADLQQRILEHMNAWSESANVEFVLTK